MNVMLYRYLLFRYTRSCDHWLMCICDFLSPAQCLSGSPLTGDDPSFRIFTGDDSCVFGCDPETKAVLAVKEPTVSKTAQGMLGQERDQEHAGSFSLTFTGICPMNLSPNLRLLMPRITVDMLSCMRENVLCTWPHCGGMATIPRRSYLLCNSNSCRNICISEFISGYLKKLKNVKHVQKRAKNEHLNLNLNKLRGQ